MFEEPLWTMAELEMALDTKMEGGTRPYIDGIQIDSREVMPGDLFVALEGAKTDGHRFLSDAAENGATALLVAADKADGVPSDMPYLAPEAHDRTLEKMAAFSRMRSAATIIGVTGSCGKTTVCHMLAEMLDREGPAHASVRSFNNFVGVPLSLARMPRSARYGIFEMGMSAAGEIAKLSAMVRPHVGVITTIAPAHIGSFENVAGIAAAKAEIFAHIEEGGTAVIGVDHGEADILCETARAEGLRTITVSLRDRTADVHALALDEGPEGYAVSAMFGARMMRFTVKNRDDVWLYNSLLALAGVEAAGGDVARAALTLAGADAEPGRGRVLGLPWSGGRITVIDDSYNAAPPSVGAAFRRMRHFTPGSAGRRIAVMADMAELGSASRDYHMQLAEELALAGFDIFYAIGPHMAALAAAAGVSYRVLPDVRGCTATLMSGLRAGDVVLVKGANRAGLSAVVDQLIGESATMADGALLGGWNYMQNETQKQEVIGL